MDPPELLLRGKTDVIGDAVIDVPPYSPTGLKCSFILLLALLGSLFFLEEPL